jgi:isopenicillin-N N-acyltransferase-like protein
VGRCVDFYAGLFQKNCKLSWPQVRDHASSYETHIRSAWPEYHEEMRGIADGSGKDLLDIVALNVRTEINFGQFSDGCTALAWKTEKRSFLGQNWDVSNHMKMHQEASH